MAADIQELVGKILSDENFARALAENPEKALADAGIAPTVDLIDALQGVDADALQRMAATFKDNQAAV